jgi:hypothetical protein
LRANRLPFHANAGGCPQSVSGISGLSQRKAAEALGVDEGTVRNDLRKLSAENAEQSRTADRKERTKQTQEARRKREEPLACSGRRNRLSFGSTVFWRAGGSAKRSCRWSERRDALRRGGGRQNDRHIGSPGRDGLAYPGGGKTKLRRARSCLPRAILNPKFS